jgi:MFS family permease
MLVTGATLPLLPSPWLAIATLVVHVLGAAGLTAVVIPALLLITPNELRGQVSALYYLVTNLIGMSLGPTAVALLTEHVFSSPRAIGPAMAVLAFVAGFASCVAAWATLGAYVARVLEARSWRDQGPQEQAHAH